MLIVIPVIICFTVMLLLLESKAEMAETNTAQLDSLRYELSYAEKQQTHGVYLAVIVMAALPAGDKRIIPGVNVAGESISPALFPRAGHGKFQKIS